jgi:hypothetical protein
MRPSAHQTAQLLERLKTPRPIPWPVMAFFSSCTPDMGKSASCLSQRVMSPSSCMHRLGQFIIIMRGNLNELDDCVQGASYIQGLIGIPEM